MTAKRDLKRRVRQRQARTGESYVTARRRVLAARGEGTKREDADTERVKTIERVEATEGKEALSRRRPIAREDSEPGEATEPAGATEGKETTRPRTEREATGGEETIEREVATEGKETTRPRTEREATGGEETIERVATGGEETPARRWAIGGEATGREETIERVATEREETPARRRAIGGEATGREETIERAATERRGQTRAVIERIAATGGETEARRSTIELEETQPGATVELGEGIESRARTEHGEREAAQRHQRGEALRRAAKLWRETGQPADIIAAGDTENAGMPVVELHEVTGEARALGFRCRITVYPTVLEACELASLLVGLQDALVRTAGDTGTARLFAVAFGLPSRPFVQVVPEPYRSDTLLRFTVSGRRGAVEIACRLWLPAPTLILRLASEIEPDLPATQSAPLHLGAEGPRVVGTALGRLEQDLFERALRLSRLAFSRRPRLFIVDGERRHPVTSDPFVIGRAAKTSDLAIRDGLVSRKHAAVIFRNGTYYIKDLGSTHGIEFKGMRIDNKRIDEGDMFRLGTHELRFTYREEG